MRTSHVVSAAAATSSARFRSVRALAHSRRTRGGSGAGFTMVEILVVLGIISLILSIALPVTFKARRQASKARAARDLSALATGLEEYKNNFNAYPQIGLGGTTAGQGTAVLYCALTGLNKAGGADPNPKSGRPRPMLINAESFRVINGTPTVNGSICDTNGKPYLYFVATVPTPDISVTTNNGMFVRDWSPTTLPKPLYNHLDCTAIPLMDMQYLMGDGQRPLQAPFTPPVVAPNGAIDTGEVPSSTAPFLLWAAGPDSVYGFDPNGKCDDVANFNFPPAYVR